MSPRPVVINTIVSPSAHAHTQIVPPAQEEQQGGVGIVFDEDWRLGIPRILVRATVPGGPANKSRRIHPGDLLVLIDGLDIHSKRLDQVAGRILGPPGTAVALGFTSPDGSFLELQLIREAAEQPNGRVANSAGAGPWDDFEEVWIPRGGGAASRHAPAWHEGAGAQQSPLPPAARRTAGVTVYVEAPGSSPPAGLARPPLTPPAPPPPAMQRSPRSAARASGRRAQGGGRGGVGVGGGGAVPD
eukprot:1434614-Rhodomonas_salina.2